MKMSSYGLARLKQWEGLRLEAYLCSAGKWTIGYGHTGDVKPGDLITAREAELLLKRDLARFESGVAALVTAPLGQHQFDALVSFAFNVGLDAFEGSTLLRKLNALDYDAVPAEFMRWNKVTKGGKKVVEPGLTNRRAAEVGLWAHGARVASQDVAPVPVAKPTVAEAAKTDTAKGAAAVAGAVGAAGAVLQAAAPHLELLESLLQKAPIALAVVAALAVVGVLIWRARRD